MLRPFVFKWEEIAQSLGIVANKIKEIKQNNRDVSQCLYEAINYWIQQNCDTDMHASWRTLCKAISEVEDMSRVVRDLAKDHRGIISRCTDGLAEQ